MKHVLLLILTVSLAGQVYGKSNLPVSKAAAPSSDKSITVHKNAQEETSQEAIYHDYDNSDVIQTGQSATKREYQYDAKVKSCRSVDGAWLRFGDVGYANCMDNSKTMKK
ncbi:hypothetical protein SHI21_15165 [Bacteriovorax sp. PP10]|uniref:Uncharacterized protein n=1 Tax=Bacteriovorax antarcticus TaxID=3088717 RepID=A0ABU5VX94_9BACT|nr:hypothetical protein [Bacteriovorax sp. PP10]MEA9357567.1 hypothetical protein [Bacteriovorax sp. PP10]